MGSLCARFLAVSTKAAIRSPPSWHHVPYTLSPQLETPSKVRTASRKLPIAGNLMLEHEAQGIRKAGSHGRWIIKMTNCSTSEEGSYSGFGICIEKSSYEVNSEPKATCGEQSSTLLGGSGGLSDYLVSRLTTSIPFNVQRECRSASLKCGFQNGTSRILLQLLCPNVRTPEAIQNILFT